MFPRECEAPPGSPNAPAPWRGMAPIRQPRYSVIVSLRARGRLTTRPTPRIFGLPATLREVARMTEPQSYVLGTHNAERERLLHQVKMYEPAARWLLEQVGLSAGARAIDVGCGPLGILDLLVERVGPTGEVVGLEREESLL